MKVKTSWFSPRLQQQMDVVRWGETGQPVLLFPTAGGDAEECERFLMLKVLDPLLSQGRIKIYSCDSVGGRALIDSKRAPQHKAATQRAFMQFVRQELVPAIYMDCGGEPLPIWAAGASIGAYNAVAMVTTYPEVFTRAIAMSGTYDLKRFLHGFHNEDVHFISPLLYLGYLEPGSAHAAKLRETFTLLPTGEGKWEDPAESWKVAQALGRLGVPNRVDLWGKDRPHDWMTWRDMLPKYLAEWTKDAAAPGTGKE